MPNCPTCPFSAPGSPPCHAALELAPVLCELARTRPAYRKMLVRRTTEGARDAPPHGTLVVRGHGNATGYGRMASYLAKALHALGQPVAFDSIEGSLPGLDPFCRDRLVGPGYGNPCVQMSSPWAVERPGACLYSMFEASRLGEKSVATYNAGRVVVVPCEWNRRVFLESGVTAPIRVVPLGVDPEVYRPDVGGKEPEGFTVLTVANLSGGGGRKRVPELIATFIEALGGRPDARLIVKIAADDVLDDPGHPRVTIDRSHHDDPGMAALYRSAAVYATMSSGEGWGMPGLESLACGRPVIAPVHSGMAEYLTPECCYPVEWKASPAFGPWYEDAGHWFRASRESMVARLREAYADPIGRRRKGEAAACRAKGFSWERSARDLLDVLREFGMAPDPATTPARVLRPVSEVRAAQLRVKACRHRTPAKCGCNGLATCSLGKGRAGQVTSAECEACVEATYQSIS